METLVQRQIRFIPIKECIEFDGQQGLRTKVMIASGSYVVFQQQSGRYPYNQHWLIERLGFEPPVQARQRLALQPAA